MEKASYDEDAGDRQAEPAEAPVDKRIDDPAGYRHHAPDRVELPMQSGFLISHCAPAVG
jgi:hypothetical protein